MVFNKRLACRISAFLCACLVGFAALASPASAVIQPPYNGDDPEVVYSTMHFDTLIIGEEGYQMSSPFAFFGLTPSSNATTKVEYIVPEQYPGDPTTNEYIAYQSGVPLDLTERVGYYRNTFVMESTLFYSAAKWSFASSSPFVSSMADLASMATSSVVLYPNWVMNYTLSMSIRYPAADTDGGYKLLPITETINHTVSAGSSPASYSAFPTISEFTQLSQVVGGKWFIVDSVRIDYEISDTTGALVDDLQITSIYSDNSARLDFVDFYENYPTIDIRYEASYPPVQNFIRNVIGGFLDIEIIPGLSFGTIFGSIIVICLVMFFLKIFAGG